jgi:hypothetical protein
MQFRKFDKQKPTPTISKPKTTDLSPKSKPCKTQNQPTKNQQPQLLLISCLPQPSVTLHSPLSTSPHPPESIPTKKPHIPRENGMPHSSTLKKTLFSSSLQGEKSPQLSRNPAKQAAKNYTKKS